MLDPVQAIRSSSAALRVAIANDGIRRLGLSWMLGVAADTALVVVILVTVFNRGGVVAASLLGAVRMVPAIIAGMFSATLIERFRGDRMLVAIGAIRAISAGLTALVIATAGPTGDDHRFTMIALFVLAAVAAAASAPVRPTQVTLMPAIARSPTELVAANTSWSTGEGLGAFAGPFIAGLLMAANLHTAVAAIASVTFVVTAWIAMGLRFEQASDASGGGRRAPGGLRVLEGIRAIRRVPVLAWTTFGTYGQVLTRGLLSALVVVATIDLLGMGQSGVGLLGAALGLGGLFGAIFAMASNRTEHLIRKETVALVFWGLPIAVIGLLPVAEIAVAAMVVVGVANATYDVALFTILQRGSRNEERASVLSGLEAVIGIGAVSGSLLAPILILVLGTRGALVAGGAILPVMALIIFLRIGHAGRISVVDERLVDLLREVPAFAELPLTAIERLVEGLVPIAYAAGTPLDDPGRTR